VRQPTMRSYRREEAELLVYAMFRPENLDDAVGEDDGGDGDAAAANDEGEQAEAKPTTVGGIQMGSTNDLFVNRNRRRGIIESEEEDEDDDE
jgi:hypothetical protein